MALSSYLSSDEWDACFYASHTKHQAPNFGESMRMTIDKLLKSGYKFIGLDENGDKVVFVDDEKNAPKMCIWLGNPDGCDILQIIINGRNFFKQHLPEMLFETDEEFEEMVKEAREKQKTTS